MMTVNDLMLGFQSFFCLGMLGICIQWHIITGNFFIQRLLTFFILVTFLMNVFIVF